MISLRRPSHLISPHLPFFFSVTNPSSTCHSSTLTTTVLTFSSVAYSFFKDLFLPTCPSELHTLSPRLSLVPLKRTVDITSLRPDPSGFWWGVDGCVLMKQTNENKMK